MAKTAMAQGAAPKSIQGAMRAPALGGSGAVAEAAATWIVGGLALLGAVVLGSILVLVFAATLALAVVLTLFLMAAAVLAQRPRPLTAVRAGAVINARKVGHSWVAYGWDKDA